MNPLFTISTLLVVSGMAIAYQAGAPEGACEDMVPQHGVPPQNTPSPYNITVTRLANKNKPQFSVKIRGIKKETIKGYFIQARDEHNKILNGTFSNIAGAKVISCPPGNKNAVTHANADEKSLVTAIYSPATNSPFHFRVTIVKDGGTFWVQQKSSTVKVQ